MFNYINSLRRRLDAKNNKILSITFNVSRYGKYTHTLNFEQPKTEYDAITYVEDWLSEILTKEYFDSVKDDLFCHDSNWQNHYRVRGNLLGDRKFLESIEIDKNGHATTRCGS